MANITNSRKILIVDDDDDIVFLIKSILERYSYDVMRASTGIEALSMVKKYNPDLIILDIMLPGMQGFSVCRKIKDDENLKKVKILMLSVKSFDADKRKGIVSGADDYMTKPFNPGKLVAKIEELLT